MVKTPRPVSLYISPANVQLQPTVRAVPFLLFLMLNFSAKFLHAERNQISEALLRFSL